MSFVYYLPVDTPSTNFDAIIILSALLILKCSTSVDRMTIMCNNFVNVKFAVLPFHCNSANAIKSQL
jgi:hypothetical protein